MLFADMPEAQQALYTPAIDLYPERPLGSLVESVCVRPKMYTLNGTLEEAGAFLDGFYSGMASHNLSKGAQKEASYWGEFAGWAEEQLGGSKRKDWCGIFQTLKDIYSEDGQGFYKLASLCIQYQQEINARNYD